MWLTSKHLAGLDGLPTSEKGTRLWLQRHGVPSRPRNASGGGLEYNCSKLPEAARAALSAKQITEAGSKALAVVDTPPVRSFLPPAPTVSNAITRVPSQAEKDVADARVRLVNLVLELVPLHGVRRACQLLAARIITGEAGAEAQNIARQANQRARGGEVSARSLERWSAGWACIAATAGLDYYLLLISLNRHRKLMTMWLQCWASSTARITAFAS